MEEPSTNGGAPGRPIEEPASPPDTNEDRYAAWAQRLKDKQVSLTDSIRHPAPAEPEGPVDEDAFDMELLFRTSPQDAD